MEGQQIVQLVHKTKQLLTVRVKIKAEMEYVELTNIEHLSVVCHVVVFAKLATNNFITVRLVKVTGFYKTTHVNIVINHA